MPPSTPRAQSIIARPWFAPALIVAMVALAYANSLSAPFLFDDAGAVVNNPTIRHLWSLDIFNPPADGSTTTGRPLVNASFALNYALSGENAWSYHALNVALHALAALTLFGLLRRVFASRSAQDSIVVAGATAALWALHPLQTETVVCIAQRTELLCGLFYMLTLYGFVRAVETPTTSRRWLVLSVIACLAGMATKEVMVTAPLIVLLFDRTFVAKTFSAAWRARHGYYVSLGATWLLLVALLVHDSGARGESAGFGLGTSVWHYLLTQCDALVRYVRLSLWPYPLVLDYGTAVATSLAEVWWQALIVTALLASTLWALVRRPLLGFAGAWFFLILAPSSSFVPLVTQTIAEHRMYLPLAGLVALLVAAFRARFGPRAVWFALAAAPVLGLTTAARNHDFRDEVTIWSDSVRHFPSSARAENNLALALGRAGRLPEANEHFARAVALNPNYPAAHNNWGLALLDQQRTGEALVQFESAIRLAENSAAGANAPQRNSELADAHYQLAQLAERARDPATAQRHYEAVVRLSPTHAAAHAALGLLFARAENLTAATEHLTMALRLAPDNVEAHANLGNVLLLQGNARGAIVEYETVLRFRPSDPRARENLQLARESLR